MSDIMLRKHPPLAPITDLSPSVSCVPFVIRYKEQQLAGIHKLSEHPTQKTLFLSRLSVQTSFRFPPRYAVFLTTGKEVRQDSEHAIIKASLVANSKKHGYNPKPERSLYHDCPLLLLMEDLSS